MSTDTAKVGVEVDGDSRGLQAAARAAQQALSKLGGDLDGVVKSAASMAAGMITAEAAMGLATKAYASASAAVTEYIGRNEEMTAAVEGAKAAMAESTDALLSQVLSADAVVEVSQAMAGAYEVLTRLIAGLIGESSDLTQVMTTGVRMAFRAVGEAVVFAANAFEVGRGAIVILDGVLSAAYHTIDGLASLLVSGLAAGLALVIEQAGAMAQTLAPIASRLSSGLGESLAGVAAASERLSKSVQEFSTGALQRAGQQFDALDRVAEETTQGLAAVGDQMVQNSLAAEAFRANIDDASVSLGRVRTGSAAAAEAIKDLTAVMLEQALATKAATYAAEQARIAAATDALAKQQALVTMEKDWEIAEERRLAEVKADLLAREQEQLAAALEARTRMYETYGGIVLDTAASVVAGEEGVAEAGRRAVAEVLDALGVEFGVRAIGAAASGNFIGAGAYAAAAIAAKAGSKALGGSGSGSGQVSSAPVQQVTQTQNTNITIAPGVMTYDMVDYIAGTVREAQRTGRLGVA